MALPVEVKLFCVFELQVERSYGLLTQFVYSNASVIKITLCLWSVISPWESPSPLLLKLLLPRGENKYMAYSPDQYFFARNGLKKTILT